ncbi:hypothetical protein [Desulfatitalea tepidiphila]|uniref:hypothetical protein n=1 Tax=Desulfatitalea tepidiphila TaxID=1185843 RepID=UPI0006B521B7|nr:hypothetical protein [Desulfatitalea tepidiphila]
MALDFEIEYCHREFDGKLTMRIMPMADGVRFGKSIEVQGADMDEIESSLRPKLLAIKEKFEVAESLKQLAQQRLDAIKAEIISGSAEKTADQKISEE